MNSLLALEKGLLAEFAQTLGGDAGKYRKERQGLCARLNEWFWDEEAGFYFDYDAQAGRLYQTPSGQRFWGLDNTLSLLSGAVPPARAARMERSLLSSDRYGKYPALTTDLSDTFMDERRLMVWVMTNWLALQGMARCGLWRPAASIAANIFNAMLRSWVRFNCLPEAFSAPHGLCPAENPNIAGVGCWAGFYLYLKQCCLQPDAGGAKKGC
jgi:neutral trehalase